MSVLPDDQEWAIKLPARDCTVGGAQGGGPSTAENLRRASDPATVTTVHGRCGLQRSRFFAMQNLGSPCHKCDVPLGTTLEGRRSAVASPFDVPRWSNGPVSSYAIYSNHLPAYAHLAMARRHDSASVVGHYP
jgi:hypothetical protein